MKKTIVLPDGSRISSSTTSTRHVETDTSAATSQSQPNDQINVVVALPAQITVKLVDAATLEALEEWTIAFTIALSCLTGFGVATIQELAAGRPFANPMVAISVFCVLAVLYTGSKAYSKREKLSSTGKTLQSSKITTISE